MPFSMQPQRVLAGSLNLLPPGDKIPDEDALALSNWRVDQAGQLRSRRGMRHQSGYFGTGQVHTLRFCSPVTTYAGIGSSLWKSPGLNNWSLLDWDYDGNRLGLAFYHGFSWIMNGAKQRKEDKDGTVTDWTIEAPATAPTVAADTTSVDLKGDYTYYVTFDTPYGHESNPSPASASITVDNVGVVLSNIPVSGDPQVSKRHIYRIGGGLDTALRVLTLDDNSTTTWTDYLSDDDAQARNTQMPVDHDAPPPARGLAGPYFGKLVAYNSAAHPERYWWTRTAQPWYFAGGQDDTEGLWEDCGEVGEEIVTHTQHARMLVLYKKHSIWRIDGDPDKADPELADPTMGVIGPAAACAAGDLAYFAGPEGIYRFNGQSCSKISAKIDPILKGDWVQVGDTYAAPLNQDYAATCCMEFANGRLYFSYPESGHQTPSCTLVYDVESQRWYQHRMDADQVGAGAFTALHHEAQVRALLGAVYTGQGSAIYSIDEAGAPTDDGSPFFLEWQSRYCDQGAPDNHKVYADVVVEYATAQGGETPSSLTVITYYDNGQTHAALGTLQSATRTKAVFRLGSDETGVEARNISVRIEGDCSSTCTIYAVYLHYYVLPRQALTFDTGVIDLGSQKVKQIDQLEFDIEATGPVSWYLHSDVPGGAVQMRSTGSFAAAGRKLRRVFSDLTEGRRFRILLTATQPFTVYGARARRLEIGEYVDVVSGGFWESEVLHYG